MIEQTPSPTDLAPEDAVLSPADTAAPAELAATAEEPDAAPATPERPSDIPAKFWDAEAGQLRTDALLKSYLELERRLGAGDERDEPAADAGPSPEEAAAEDPAQPDIPPSPDAYEIETESELVTVDPEVNRRLHEAGFSQEQARLVYKLAEEYLLPAVSDAYGEVVVQQELGRLEAAFGGGESWQATAEQLRNWGRANLDGHTYETLAASYDGVMAMHAMMQAREPAVVHADAPAPPADESGLRRMMQDPRYWRDKDPAFIAEVTRGYQRLFSG